MIREAPSPSRGRWSGPSTPPPSRLGRPVSDFVHQNPAVFPALSVAENIAIGTGFDKTRAGSINWRALRRRTEALLERFDINARSTTLVRSLRPAERAMVAIARTLADEDDDQPGILVLDEPTASLPRAEVVRLMAALVRYAKAGQTILFVSHRLDEVIDAADTATVLRDGQLAGTLQGDQITEPNIIELIVGRALDRVFPEMPEVASEELALEVRGLAGGPASRRELPVAPRRGAGHRRTPRVGPVRVAQDDLRRLPDPVRPGPGRRPSSPVPPHR